MIKITTNIIIYGDTAEELQHYVERYKENTDYTWDNPEDPLAQEHDIYKIFRHIRSGGTVKFAFN